MNSRPHFGILALSVAALACSVFVGGPDLPDAPVSNSSEDLQALRAAIEQAMSASLLDGTLRLQITQEQMTAYLASRIASQANPVITEPQVVLGDQEMVVYGRARSGFIEANMAVTAQFDIDADGRPQITITNAALGPMPMPQAFRDAIAAAVDETLTGSFGPVAIGFRLESVEIDSGVMTISGRVR